MEKIEKIIRKIKTHGLNRRLDELGRIVIPCDYRKGKVEDGKTKIAIHRIKDYAIVEILNNPSEEITRKFDELGRVVINIEIRQELQWEEKDLIEVWSFENYFILKKVEEKCIFCKNDENLITFKEQLVCKKCKKELEIL